MAEHSNAKNDIYMYHFLYLPRGIERLEKFGKPVSIKKNTILNEADQPAKYCYVLKKGMVIAYEYTYSGEQRIYNIMESGSLFMEEFLLFDLPCPITFKALTDCELVLIDKCALKRGLKRDVDVALDICESLSYKFLSCMEYLRFEPKNSADWKICKLLLMFSKLHGKALPDGRILYHTRLSQQMIGDILGMNRVTVAKKFKNYKTMGILSFDPNTKRYILEETAIKKYMDSLSE